MAEETQDVRLARVEERVRSHDDWIERLQADIADSKSMLREMRAETVARLGVIEDKLDGKLQHLEGKLDDAIERANRAVPGWVHYALWVLIAAGSLLAGIAIARP